MAKEPIIRINAGTQTRTAAVRFERAKVRLSGETARGVSDIAAAAKRTFIFFAPVQSGRLRRGIRARKTGWKRDQIDISISAVNPETGYDYVGVTRFGHKAEWIYPKQGSRLKLNFVGGFWSYAPRVKGYRPDFDWAEEALATSHAIAEDQAHKLSHRLDLRLLG